MIMMTCVHVLRSSELESALSNMTAIVKASTLHNKQDHSDDKEKNSRSDDDEEQSEDDEII